MYQAFRVVTSGEDCGEPEGEFPLGMPYRHIEPAQMEAQLDFNAIMLKHCPGEPLHRIVWDNNAIGSLGDGAPMHYIIKRAQ